MMCKYFSGYPDKLVYSVSRLIAALLLPSLGLFAQVSVVTQHYDNYRSGANLNESTLTPSNINTATFGKLFTTLVDGYIYAQPLYIPNLTIPGNGTHNVVFIATEHDSVYAFDADNNGGTNATPLWHITLLDSAHGAAAGATTEPSSDVSSADLVPEIGITSTPVIDPVSGTMYLIGQTKEAGNAVQRLHALDITTGAEKFGGPVVISAAVPGTGNGSSGGMLHFDPKWANNRAGLLLQNGIVYAAFGSHGDNGPWHGWILAYNAQTLQQTGVYCTTPNGTGSGIWMAGSGLAADVIDPVNSPFGRMFVATGNGSYSASAPYTNSMSFGDDHLRLDLTNGVPVIEDSFTPYNQFSLQGADLDVASGGVLLLPDQTSGGHTHLLVQAGKQGSIYLVDRDNMGGYSTTSDNVVQEITNQIKGLWSMPAYWNNNVYFWGRGDHLKAFSFNGGLLSTTPTSVSSETSNYPGSTPVVSALANSNAIVWTVQTDAYNVNGSAVLQAHDATNVATTLYSSNQNLGRDNPGPAVKFTVPVVANGKVYVGAQKQFSVYGLLGQTPQAAAPVISPPGTSFLGSTSLTISDATPGAVIFYTTDGSTPNIASQVYSGPITVSTTTTINAIASATGYLQSSIASATFTLLDQVAAPVFSPAPGAYAATQTVSISDTTPNAIIYYTLDGSTPTASSTVYTAPITVSSTTTINAIGMKSGDISSAVITGTYTITGNFINFANGFSTSSSSMTFNGSTTLDDSRLQLTNGGQSEAGSAFYNTPVGIQTFTNDFTFQISNPNADGFTFTIQGNGPTALGRLGGGLGYGPSSAGGTGGIPKSVAVKFDLYNNAGEGSNSTGVYTNGAMPTVPATTITGVNLHSGDTMSVHMTYDGTTLKMTITDGVKNVTFSTQWTVNIPAAVGSNVAYVGFTGGTGSQTASQKIETWTFVPTANPQANTPVLSPAAGTYMLPQSVTISDTTTGASIFYTTDGTTPSSSSLPYTGPISLSGTTTIQAIATATNFAPSAVASATYTVPSPNFTLSASPSSVSITQGASATATVQVTPQYGFTGAVQLSTSTLPSGISVTFSPTSTSTTSTATFSVTSSVATGSVPITIIGTSGSLTQTAAVTLTVNSPETANPVFSPAAGTYTSAQTVSISDTTPNAIIYYTLDGTTPTTSSSVYAGPIAVNSATTIKAMAAASGLANSPVVSAAYSIQTGSTGVNFANGFVGSSTAVTLNGSAALDGSRLQLTNGGSMEKGSAFFDVPVNIQTFTNNFTFQLTKPNADGFTFTIQSNGPTALGALGGALGYGPTTTNGKNGIPNSVAVKFDLYSNAGEGSNSTGLYTNGAMPTLPATTITGVSLHSGDVLSVQMTYDGTTLSMTISDAAKSLSFTTQWTVNIPSIVGGNTAYIGFTGGTGSSTANQEILTWTFTP